MKYKLIIKDKSENAINELDWSNFNFSFELNREGKCTVRTNVDLFDKFDMNNLYPSKSYVDIYRYNTKIWSGILTSINGDIDSDSGNMDLNFSDYLYLLKRMKISPLGKTFTLTDQGSILWGLINDFQSLPNGNYGITFGSINTGILRDRTYKAGKGIYEAAIEMTEVVNGCDLEVTQEKVLNVYAKKGHRLGHVLEYGKNILGFSFGINGDEIVNHSTAYGSGEDTDMLYSVAHNIQSQEKYGLCQGIILKPDVILINTLTEAAQGDVAEHGEPTNITGVRLMPTNDPPLMSYLTGDEIRVKVKKGWFDFDKYKRIKKITVDVSIEEKEDISVEFL